MFDSFTTIVLTVILVILFVLSHALIAAWAESGQDPTNTAAENAREDRFTAACIFALWAAQAALFYVIAS